MATRSAAPGPRVSGSWLRFVAAVVVLLVVAVGIPVGLVVTCRAGLGASHPLPGIGTTDEIRSWVTTQRSSTEIARVALRVLISLCWLLWAGLLLSVLSSVVASRPGLGRVRLPRLAVFDGFGAWIAAGLTALTSLAPNIAHAQPAMAPIPAAVSTATMVAASTITPRDAAPAAISSTPSRAGWETVQPAESIEMFAARTLGSGERWPEVWELNKGRTMDDGVTFAQPYRLVAGWQLELPVTATPAPPPPEATVMTDQAAPAASNAPYRPVEEVVVVDDDNLWNLCRARLRAVGAPDNDVAVGQLVHEVVALNPSIEDPDVIYTGQRIVMPAVGVPPTDPAPAPTPAAAAPVSDPVEDTHTIVRGDTLWHIIKSRYGHVDGALVDYVAAYNQLSDPNNIPLGTVIRLPALPDSAVTVPAMDPVDVVAVPVTTAPVVEIATAPTTVPGPAPAPTVHEAAPVLDDPAAGPDPIWAAPVVSMPPLRLVPPPPSTASVTMAPSSPLPWAVAGVASVGLATGLLELWRRRRRARWAAGGSPWQIGAASEQPPVELTEVADLITVEWVAAALSHLAAATDGPAVVSVEYDQTVLAVRWNAPRPIAPSPWWSSDDGWVWNLPSSARLIPAADGPVVGFPGLVTFGERGGRQYLINLAAFGTLAVDGPGAEAFTGALVLELGTGELLSDAAVHLHGVELASGEQIERVMTDFDDPVDPASPTLHVSVIESDDPALDDLIVAAAADAHRAVLILGSSERTVGTELRIEADGAAVQEPGGIPFQASLVAGAIVSIDPTSRETPTPTDGVQTSNVVKLDLDAARGTITAPRTVLRLFSSLLPDLDPRPAGIDARVMTIVAALDYLGTGRPPQQLAELLRVKVKTIQNKLGRLRELQLVHSDGNIWTLDAGVCSDAEWMLALAGSARDATSRETANRALNECWELFTRVTGPAYAAGGGSSLWGWVDERDEDLGGATAVEQATNSLFQAVGLAVEVWDKLSATGTDDLISANGLVDMLLRVESTLRVVEPWPLFEAAAVAAGRTGLASTRQKLATRLAQLVHDSNLDPPEALVEQVIG